MGKRAFYIFLKFYMRVFIRFFFGKTETVGLDKIPIGKPIIYSCNHQNAFMDALLIGAISPIKITSMTRSDVFNTPLRWFMEAVQMMPIYRLRDGIDKLALNEKIFENIRELLKNDQAILIFSEGNHGNEYFLRPLSKGSSRMALESFDKLQTKDIQIVPIGINYLHHQRPLHKLTLVFGDPIPVSDYYAGYKNHEVKGTNALKEKVEEGMKKCLWIAEENEGYHKMKAYINRKNEALQFFDFKEKLAKGLTLNELGKHNKWLYRLGLLFGIINFLPLLLLQKVLKPIRDIVFYGSLKYAFGLFVFPIWWILVFTICLFSMNIQIALIVVAVQIITLFMRQFLIKWSNQAH